MLSTDKLKNKEVINIADGRSPVSYTHLDVYKRQLHVLRAEIAAPEERKSMPISR